MDNLLQGLFIGILATIVTAFGCNDGLSMMLVYFTEDGVEFDLKEGFFCLIPLSYFIWCLGAPPFFWVSSKVMAILLVRVGSRR